jgi:hypothetical protein
MTVLVWSGKFLLALVSTIILGSEFRGTHEHILLSHDSGSRAAESLTAGEVHHQFTRPDCVELLLQCVMHV